MDLLVRPQSCIEVSSETDDILNTEKDSSDDDLGERYSSWITAFCRHSFFDDLYGPASEQADEEKYKLIASRPRYRWLCKLKPETVRKILEEWGTYLKPMLFFGLVKLFAGEEAGGVETFQETLGKLLNPANEAMKKFRIAENEKAKGLVEAIEAFQEKAKKFVNPESEGVKKLGIHDSEAEKDLRKAMETFQETVSKLLNPANEEEKILVKAMEEFQEALKELQNPENEEVKDLVKAMEEFREKMKKFRIAENEKTKGLLEAIEAFQEKAKKFVNPESEGAKKLGIHESEAEKDLRKAMETFQEKMKKLLNPANEAEKSLVKAMEELQEKMKKFGIDENEKTKDLVEAFGTFQETVTNLPNIKSEAVKGLLKETFQETGKTWLSSVKALHQALDVFRSILWVPIAFDIGKKIILGEYRRGPIPISEAQEEFYEEAAELLYGIVHRIYTNYDEEGIKKMKKRFANKAWGSCPRYFCYDCAVWPIGPDFPGQDHVRVFCPICKRTYISRDPSAACIDGFFFGDLGRVMAEQRTEQRKNPEYRVHGFRLLEGTSDPGKYFFSTRHIDLGDDTQELP